MSNTDEQRREQSHLLRIQQQKAEVNYLAHLEKNKRIQEALAAAKKARENPHTVLTPKQEYQAELGRKLQKDGQEAWVKPEADQDISQAMAVAGYSGDEILEAVRHGSPHCANLTKEDQNRYLSAQVITALKHPKTQENIQIMSLAKSERKLAHERRLDRLGLATQVSQIKIEQNQTHKKIIKPEFQ